MPSNQNTKDVIRLETTEKKSNHYSNLLEAAIAFFGLTQDVMEAGYITPSGDMIDMSGRHLKVGLPEYAVVNGNRNLLHSNFAGVNKNGYNLLDDFPELYSDLIPVTYFMVHTGCVRVDKHDRYASFTNYVTDAQVDTLAEMFKGDELMIEFSCSYFQELDSTIIDNCTKFKLKRWIDKCNSNF